MTEDPSATWSQREQYWRRKLGRIKLGVEPVEVQVEKYRLVTWVLTAVTCSIGLIVLALFTVFGRPAIGAAVVALMFLPIVASAWIDYSWLKRRASAYLREKAEFEAKFVRDREK